MTRKSKAPDDQYRLRTILRLWAVVTLPMILLAWGVTPVLIPRVPIPPAILYWLIIAVGMALQLCVSLWVVRREEGNLHWASIRRRVWLNRPRDPRTGQPGARFLRWLLPCLFVASISLGFGILFSKLALFFLRGPYVLLFLSPAHASVIELASPEFTGQWWLVGLALVSWAFNTFLAEEFLFRGILLPKMSGVFGRWDWVANAILYGLYHLYRPWMILFRLVNALAIAWPTRRFRSTWMAVIVRGVEGIGVLAIVLIGITTPQLEPLPTPITLPTIDRRPTPADWGFGAMTSVPTYDPDSSAMWQMDLRSYDLSALDLRDASEDLMYADFDSRTAWPAEERMPPSFDPEEILALGKNPGLGIRGLHARGITGRGVSIAIIDQTLLTGHQEYAEQLQWYEEINAGAAEPAAMHGPAVASIAVGETVGVAPEASLYYIGVGGNLKGLLLYYHYYAQGIRRILQINEALPQDQKIRVLSISLGWSVWGTGYYDIVDAAEQARAQGILVVCSSIEELHGFKFHGLGRPPLADPDSFEAYEPGLWWADRFYAGDQFSDRLLIPMDSRTTASPTGVDEYVFYRQGGWSWAIPYIAGVYALAVQVDPTITPERFWSLALETGRTIALDHDGETVSLGPIIDPVALVGALE